MEQHNDIALLIERGVNQSRTSSPYGNCVEASIATLLNLDIADIPDVRAAAEERGFDDKMFDAVMKRRKRVLCRWLAEAFDLFWIEGEGTRPPIIDTQGPNAAPLFWLAGGQSPRGLGHMVVYADDELVWDPHPSRLGLEKVERWGVLVPLGILDGR